MSISLETFSTVTTHLKYTHGIYLHILHKCHLVKHCGVFNFYYLSTYFVDFWIPFLFSCGYKTYITESFRPSNSLNLVGPDSPLGTNGNNYHVPVCLNPSTADCELGMQVAFWVNVSVCSSLTCYLYHHVQKGHMVPMEKHTLKLLLWDSVWKGDH